MKTIHPIILEILKKRGLESPEELSEFLSVKPRKTYDPYLLLNMKEGVDLIMETINAGRKICVYGDYDADGVTATALMVEFLRNLTDNIDYYIPSRFDEGYGLNKNALDFLKSEGASLIVTVDCGSISREEVAYGKKIGLDILVTDHHNINDKPAECLLINPKQELCPYPYKNLSGCGVAFKLAQALQRKNGMPKATINNLLDLVAIANIGDIVPLLDENRTTTKYGLSCLNNEKRRGLSALISKVGIKKGEINSGNVAYVIVPHLNAAGRMGNADICVKLLISKDEKEIDEASNLLIKSNSDRKLLQEEIFDSCISIVERKHKDDLFLVVNAGNAHEGITGIVAGKIKDRYMRPTIILTETNMGKEDDETQIFKGTGRSLEGVDLYNMLVKHGEIFEKFGGHSGACGLSIKKDKIHMLRELLNEDMKSLLYENPNLFDKKIDVDGDLTDEDLSLDFVEQTEKLEPFGFGNGRPLFRWDNLTVTNLMFLGNKKQHVKFSAFTENKKELSCILFNRAIEYAAILEEKFPMEIIGYADINSYNGKKTIQIKVEAIGEVHII